MSNYMINPLMRAGRKSAAFAGLVFLLAACSQAATDAAPQNSTGANEPSPTPQEEEAAPMQFKKLTPVLLAQDVAACADFWNRLGLETTMSVPAGDGLGFVALSNGVVELMYQSFESAAGQNPAVIEDVNRAVVFMEVASLDKILAQAGEMTVVVPEHKTDYGSREIYVRDPAGNVIGFAEQGAQ